jgi:methanogenic corrinoid protein MtbC1
MDNLLNKITECIENGKINATSSYPPHMKGQDGADELTKRALEAGIAPSDILNEGLVRAMNNVGQKFSDGKIFVPQMLMSAKAMTTAMVHMKPFFTSGEVKRKGTFIIGTVAGDLHDIGKNLVAMIIEGAGWEVIDLGVDVKPEKFIEAIELYPNCVVGLSALLTTTMMNMENTVIEIKKKYPRITILIGGAPLTAEFCQQIGADFYSRDPQGAVEYLRQIAA